MSSAIKEEPPEDYDETDGVEQVTVKNEPVYSSEEITPQHTDKTENIEQANIKNERDYISEEITESGSKDSSYVKFTKETVSPKVSVPQKTQSKSKSLEPPLKRHKQKSYRCDICMKVLSTLSTLRYHTDIIHNGGMKLKQYECDFCGKRYACKFQLAEHIYTHSRERKFPCGICGKRFRSEFTLKHHARCHTNKAFKCKICHKVLRTQKKLHLLTHSSEKPFPCHLCEKQYVVRYRLTRHLNTQHSGERHPCDICDKSFADKYHMIRHIKQIHRIGSFPCHMCGKVFNLEKSLDSHLQSHDRNYNAAKKVKLDQEGYNFQCHICNKVFKLKKSIASHLLKHGKYSSVEKKKRNKILIFGRRIVYNDGFDDADQDELPSSPDSQVKEESEQATEQLYEVDEIKDELDIGPEVLQ